MIFSSAPSISVQISNSTNGIAGENYDLICSVLGAENLSPSITYQWTKNSNGQIQVGTNSNTLSFTPVRLSDAANYSCTVAITLSYLSAGMITAMASQSVRIQSRFQEHRLSCPNIIIIIIICSPNSVFYHIDKQRAQFHPNCWISCNFNLFCGIKFSNIGF